MTRALLSGKDLVTAKLQFNFADHAANKKDHKKRSPQAPKGESRFTPESQ